MLRNVLVDYLDNVSERDFDLPFLALLPALGFYDVHYVHGQAEFGKDFIAKRCDDNVETQYSFQLKAGNIRQSEWRNNVQGQMLEAVINKLSHPNFNRDIPYQSVFVTTGRVLGNAALGFDEFNKKVEQLSERQILLWDREKLASDLAVYGLSSIHWSTASDLANIGEFFKLYGDSVNGCITERDIEYHSRCWVDKSSILNTRLLCAVLEAELFAFQAMIHGDPYIALQSYLAVIRLVLAELASDTVEMLDLYHQAITKITTLCRSYVTETKDRWLLANKNLTFLLQGSSPFYTYLVQCCRIMEVSALAYFLSDDIGYRNEVAEFLEDFVLTEPGCSHIPSDRYAISLVLSVLVLSARSRSEAASTLLRRSAVWLCDRYDDGWGLASFGAEPCEEVATLLGYPFSGVADHKAESSLLACVISDLGAFLNNKELYSDIVNDIIACKIHPKYFQVPDNASLFSIEGPDLITYPHVVYADEIGNFCDYEFASHIEHESRSYQITELIGVIGLLPIIVLLRDRYFPTIWPEIINL